MREKNGLHLERNPIGHQAAARLERRYRGPHHARLAAAAADENGIRLLKAIEGFWSRACHHMETRHAETCRIACNALGALGIGLDGDGSHGGMRQHPLDGDRARAAADIPQKLAAPWREGFAWEGGHEWLSLGESRLRVYRLEGHLGRRHRIVVQTTRVGEILRVELPGQVVLLNDGFVP